MDEECIFFPEGKTYDKYTLKATTGTICHRLKLLLQEYLFEKTYLFYSNLSIHLLIVKCRTIAY